MTSKERFIATIERKPVDRPATWLGIPDIASYDGLFAEFNVNNLDDLKNVINDDLYAVEIPYHSETSNAIYAAFNWYGNDVVDSHERTLTADGCFKDAEELSDIDFFDWPDPTKYIDPKACKEIVESAPADKAILGILWSSHFQDTCAAFGMETAMINMLTNPQIYKAVDAKIVEFYLKANEVFYKATKGKLDAVLIGNDMGSQRGLMLSPDLIREFIIPNSKLLIEQAHSYGVKVIYHSCGSIDAVINDLIDAGVDAINPIQALASGMEPNSLKQRFGDKVSFCGGVDAQNLLVSGNAREVKNKVLELKKIFPTGLIISPSHEAILPDVPPKNIRAIFDETVNDST